MTDAFDTDGFEPDDELVSAVLDGEAGPADRARVEGDPRLAARLAELRSIAEAVSAPVGPPSAAAREQVLAAALAAAVPLPEAPAGGDAPDAAGVAPAAGPAPMADQLAARRAARARRAEGRGTSRTVRLLRVAAVLVLAALAVPLVRDLGETESEKFESVGLAISAAGGDDAGADLDRDAESGGAETADTPQADAAESGTAAGSEDLAAATTVAPAPPLGSTAWTAADLGDLGAVDDIDQLASALGLETFDSAAAFALTTSDPSGGGSPLPCETAARVSRPVGALTASATLTWDGIAATVLVFRTQYPDQPLAAVVVDGTCAVLATTPLPR